LLFFFLFVSVQSTEQRDFKLDGLNKPDYGHEPDASIIELKTMIYEVLQRQSPSSPMLSGFKDHVSRGRRVGTVRLELEPRHSRGNVQSSRQTLDIPQSAHLQTERDRGRL